MVTVVEFHSEAGEIQYVFAPNEHPQRIFCYIARQLEPEPSKTGHSFFEYERN